MFRSVLAILRVAILQGTVALTLLVMTVVDYGKIFTEIHFYTRILG
jgi:hypothetical protein